ncbi:hypothetical protein [Rhizobium sp. BK251]|uniref:hypothetical protein n=1 Tax=Rhizobium sp. BK251 TaxID=2512125 RepID=UPI001046F192|nr:hypothetical protein [Rhizobium sp. BK251]TCL70617.1 hypothetical protein EV286_107494 [Rhizobium sp. BK251]
MKFASIAIASLILATPAAAGDSLKMAALFALQVDTCGEKADSDFLREIIVHGSVEENVTLNDAFNIVRGMQRAYTDIAVSLGTSEYCASTKQLRTRQ